MSRTVLHIRDVHVETREPVDPTGAALCGHVPESDPTSEEQATLPVCNPCVLMLMADYIALRKAARAPFTFRWSGLTEVRATTKEPTDD